VVSTKAQLLVQLGRVAEAEALYRQLLSLNPDDYSVHEGPHRGAAAAGVGGGRQWLMGVPGSAAAAGDLGGVFDLQGCGVGRGMKYRADSCSEAGSAASIQRLHKSAAGPGRRCHRSTNDSGRSARAGLGGRV
jgi:hypothetical protein